MNCKFCGADNDYKNLRCYSCSAPLPIKNNLSEKDYESLKNYTNAVEKMLKAAKKEADGIVIFYFLLFSAVGILATYLIHKELSLRGTLLFGGSIGFVLFITFGFTIMYYEDKAVKKKFDRKIKDEIEEYLKIMEFHPEDFKQVASEVLSEKSYLIKHIHEF